jgi:hypothetical protein
VAGLFFFGLTYSIRYIILFGMATPSRTGPTAREAFLQETARLWPVAKGSLAQVRRPCMRRNCQACVRGDKHPGWIFVFREKGRQRCLYVRKRLVPALRQAILNGRRLEERLTRAGQELIERDRQEGRSRRDEP